MDSVPAVDERPTDPTGQDKVETKKERTGRYVALFVLPFLMVTMMFATYVGTMHSPHPREMPIAVVGAGTDVAETVSVFESGAGSAVEIFTIPTVEEATRQIEQQEIAAALVIPQSGTSEATLVLANAAGPSQAAAVQQLVAPVALEQGWEVVLEDVAPLPEGDSSGTAALFGAMGMMLAGYVPLSLLMLSLPHLLALRRFVPLVVGWGIGTSSLIWMLLGPVVGAVDGHFLTFLGVGTLAVSAVGLAQLLFTKLMGPLAVLIGMLLYVVFGMPASNLALSLHVMPGFFQFLHGVLPLPAAGEALRSYLYFDGQGAGGHLLTLGIWLVAALALCAVKERASGIVIPGAPKVESPDTPLPALAGGPKRTKRVRYAAALLFPLSIVVMVVGVMGFSLHKPQVHDLPVAVVAASTADAQRTVEEMQPSMEGVLDLRVATLEEATQLVQLQEIVAIYQLPAQQGDSPSLLTSGGAGVSQQTAVQAIFSQIGAQQGTPIELTDLTPLTPDDTMGSNSMYVGMAWIMAGFLMLAVLRGGAPELTRFRQFLPLLTGWSIGMAFWLWLLFDVIIGAVTGHALAIIGIGALTIFSIAAVTAVFTRTLGLAAIIPVMVVLMLAGVPASGGGLSIYMVPELFRPLQDLLPLPAAVDTARSLTYFGGEGVWGNILVIAIWGVIGLLLNRLVDHRNFRQERRQRAAQGPTVVIDPVGGTDTTLPDHPGETVTARPSSTENPASEKVLAPRG